MKTVKVSILDNVFCKVYDKSAFNSVLSYRTTFWRQGPFNSKKKVSTGCMVDRRNGNFLAGLLSRLQNKFNIELQGEFTKNKFNKVKLKHGKLRDYQKDIVQKAIKAERGVISATTGSGKTYMAIALSSAMNGTKLFLCDSIDLLKQTSVEYRKQHFKVMELGDGRKFDLEILQLSDVLVSTIQSFVKIDPKLVIDLFSLIIVDECHCCTDTKSMYGKVLQRLNCYHKYGLTATPPTDKKSMLTLEGLIGPIIAEYNVQKGIEQGTVAKPKITFIPIKINSNLTDLKSYKEIYNKCIINNLFRNNLIILEANRRTKENKSILIIVREIKHGDNLIKVANKRNITAKFVNGSTPGQTRELVKEVLNEKIIKIVICTDVWTQGIDIPELDCVLNARGGKSRREILQFIGRGTRATKTKKELEIIELLDSYKYLSQHLVMRLNIYSEKGWI